MKKRTGLVGAGRDMARRSPWWAAAAAVALCAACLPPSLSLDPVPLQPCVDVASCVEVCGGHPSHCSTTNGESRVPFQLGHRCMPKRGAIHTLDQPAFILLSPPLGVLRTPLWALWAFLAFVNHELALPRKEEGLDGPCIVEIRVQGSRLRV